jgi:hypothetical protein
LNADFTMRSPDAFGGDLDRLLSVAGSKPLYIQEIGYASAERLNSSPAKQAQFVGTVFEALRRQRARVIGATFLFMSDLPKAMVDFFGSYYGSNNGNFKAYLQTLGLHERNGTAKPAWAVVAREAQSLKQVR